MPDDSIYLNLNWQQNLAFYNKNQRKVLLCLSHKKYIWRTRERLLLAKKEEIEKFKETCKFPAYFSVIIFFDAKPNDIQIETIKRRAYKFIEMNKEKQTMTIEGFRMIEIISTLKEYPI